MAKIIVENKIYEVKDGQNLLSACLSLGFDLPYFCWHPAMHSVGACRQCAIKQFKDENDKKGRIVMACMTPAAEGARVSIDDPEAKAFRADVTEWMMINHPHDCPVCDEGGECHLQDMTLMAGHVRRRSRFKKRTYTNQQLGPFLNHEMNRCIQCYRCVRFYRGYAGGTDLNVFSSHDNVYFGRHEDGALSSEFSGNLAEVCPTGVFTDKTFKRHYSRKWDLQTAPSVCVHCAVGCNTIPGERYGQLRRIRNRYNGEVNRYFLCDRGRFGYEFVNGPVRIKKTLFKHRGEGGAMTQARLSPQQAIGKAVEVLRTCRGVMGIGSPRASLEANYALRSLVGAENFYMGLAASDHGLIRLALENLSKGTARPASLGDVEASDAVLLLGEDATNTAPMLALSLRQAARQAHIKAAQKLKIPYWDDAAVRTASQDIKSAFHIAVPYETKLDDIAGAAVHLSPDDIARVGFAIAHELDPDEPGAGELPEELQGFVSRAAKDLRGAERPLVVSGTALRNEAIINAAATVARALAKAGKAAALHYALPECNSAGAALMEEKSLDDALRAAYDKTCETAVILENDLFRRAEKELVSRALDSFTHIIVLDTVLTQTAAAATLALPSSAFAASDGTLVSSEGRAQRHFRVYSPEGNGRESWKWLSEIRTAYLGSGWHAFDEITKALSEEIPVFRKLSEAAGLSGFRVDGMKIARQTHRASGRTAVSADKTVFVPKPPEDRDSPFSFSMEGYHGTGQVNRLPSSLIPRFWSPGWNSVQSVNKFQAEMGGGLKGGDPGIRLIEGGEGGAVAIPFVPEAFTRKKNEWLLVPIYHIFGSEEMSMLSPSVAGLAPEPYIGLGPDEARRLGVAEGDAVAVRVWGVIMSLPVKVIGGLQSGLAGLPVLPLVPTLLLPKWCVLTKVKISVA